MALSQNLKAVHARLLILDIPSLSYPVPVVTQLSLLTSPDQYFLANSKLMCSLLPLDIQAQIIDKARQLVGKVHSYATHLMSVSGQSYTHTEINEQLALQIQIRISYPDDLM